MNSDDAQKIQERWNRSRTVMQFYLCIMLAVMVAFYFYGHAIRYEQTYDANCNAPGTLISQIWSWNFIIQSMYVTILILDVLGWIMLVNWYGSAPYVAYVIWSLLVVAFLLATAIFLSVQASNANTCESVGNVASSFEICNKCGQFNEWNGVCFNTALYNPPVVGGYAVNLPRAFQLAMHWIMFFVTLFGLVYVPTEYVRAQQGYIPFVLGSTATEPQEDDAEEDERSEGMPKAARAQQLQGLKIHGRISHASLRTLVK